MATASASLLVYGALAIVVTYQTIASALSFWKNLRTARQSGLPYKCRCVFEYNYAFLAIQPLLTAIIERLPQWLNPFGYLDIYRKDWRVHVKHRIHGEVGDVFWNVSPGYLLLEIADANVVTQVTSRRTDFVKPRWVFENIRLFGPNIIEADEHDWRRHRRVVGPCYNDTLHAFVWEHACKLAKDMSAGWKSPGSFVPYAPGTVSREGRDCASLALRVIVGAAFNIFIPFYSAAEAPAQVPANEQAADYADTVAATSFAESLMLVMSNLVTVMIFPKKLIALSSEKGMKIATAIDSVRYYMHDMLFAEVDKGKALEKATTTVSDAKKKSKTDITILRGLAGAVATGSPPGDDQLTYMEAIGDIFLMALAGSATTGDTIHFALVLLAIDQATQEWVCDQLDEVTSTEGLQWDYQNVFPKLTRLHNVMMETLRLFPVTPVLPKWTADKAQALNVSGQTIMLPPQTVVVLSFPGIHYNPRYWGPNPSEFRPQQWTGTPPVDGAFVPFSRGARACLGKRFSESEFIAVMSTLLRDHRVGLEVGPGETMEGVRARAVAALGKSKTYLTLSVGDHVPLRWVPR